MHLVVGPKTNTNRRRLLSLSPLKCVSRPHRFANGYPRYPTDAELLISRKVIEKKIAFRCRCDGHPIGSRYRYGVNFYGSMTSCFEMNKSLSIETKRKLIALEEQRTIL